jgi:ABC-type uncharacterized transport system auxiliary subunit
MSLHMPASLARRRLLQSGLLGALPLAACSVLPERPYQERREWPLQVRRAAQTAAPPGAPVLLLRAVRAGPGLDARGLRTRRPDGAEHLDYWEEWAVPPPQAIEDSMRQWLAASGHFTAVTMPGSQAVPDLVIEAELTALLADLPAGEAAVTLVIVITRGPAAGYRPLRQLSLTGTAPLTGQTGAALASAMTAAVAALMSQAENAVH